MAKDVELATSRKAYARWAPIYDRMYRKILLAGRIEAVKAAMACGHDILEVGVGTGLSLPDYPRDYRVFGIDLSKDMLDRAASKVALGETRAEIDLAVMDACRLGFRDTSFDAVAAQYVITLVPDAEAALDEFARVLRPGGEIILVNHIGAEKGIVAWWEKTVAPIAKRFGWRTEFPLQRLRDWAALRGFSVAQVKRVGTTGFFTLIRLRDGRAEREKAVAA